jgi:hypothetical protein
VSIRLIKVISLMFGLVFFSLCESIYIAFFLKVPLAWRGQIFQFLYGRIGV